MLQVRCQGAHDPDYARALIRWSAGRRFYDAGVAESIPFRTPLAREATHLLDCYHPGRVTSRETVAAIICLQ